jgi:hypothetical protein
MPQADVRTAGPMQFAQSISKSAAVLALTLAAACGRTLSEPPEIASQRDGERLDLVFFLAQQQRLPGGRQILSAKGVHEGRAVGFELELGPWRENPPGFVNLSTWECSARLISQGQPSDDLLRALDVLYGTHSSPDRMRASIELSALSPWKDPGDLSTGTTKLLMLFTAPALVDRAAEVWIDVDLEHKRIGLREKERALRSVLVQTLTRPPEEQEP